VEIHGQRELTSCVNSYGGRGGDVPPSKSSKQTPSTHSNALNDESFATRQVPDEVACKRYCPVVVGPNGRIKPDWVMVNDRQEEAPGRRLLPRLERRRKTADGMSVGTDAAAA